MKRLGAFVFATILAISILGVFDMQKTFAQTSVTVEQILQHAIPIFQDKLSALNNELTLFANKHGGINSQEYKDYKLMNDAMAAATRDAKSVFEATLANGPAGRSPSDLYGDALLEASKSLVNKLESNPLLQKPEAAAYINSFRQELMAEVISQQRIKAITTGRSIDQAAQDNAKKTIELANPGKQSSKEKCSLTSFSISDCIDAFVAWLIKNTFLQIGGFFVWLTANMLNLAIQVSILDFSKWATSELYPIWTIIRQIVSLFVVFAGLYLGFMYIVGRTEVFGRYIGWLVLFALFVNFSYPFSRALVDVSNIVSLNVYSAAVGTEPLAGGTDSTAGAIIMDKLGLQGLVASATSAEGSFLKSINSTPGALLAVVFVFYAAYVFFMAAAIIATRMIVLIFLIVASPLLLVDSVIPKLGEAAATMRKMFFEQLAVAPVFMIVLALTLKFMDVFSAAGSLSGATGATFEGGGASSVQTFFNILIMLVMLHIMLKVTKSIAGQAGQMATNFMGKVGGFGLAAATGGAGLLARGTIGAGAARLRDSAWMDKLQGSRAGRGLYGLSNSLAQSSFDARNVGMISGGMAKAGLTGGLGLGMQKGSTQTYDRRFAEKQSAVVKKYESIKDDQARAAYFDKTQNGVSSTLGRKILGKSDGDKIAEKMADSERSIQEKRKTLLAEYARSKPEDRSALLAKSGDDYVLLDKLQTVNKYLTIDNQRPDSVQRKVGELVKLNDSDLTKQAIENDPFSDIRDAYKKEIEVEEAELETADRKKEIFLAGADGRDVKTTEYEMKRKALAEKKAKINKEIDDKRKELLEEYRNNMNEISGGPVDVDLTGNEPNHPGGSDFSHLDQNEHPVPVANMGQPQYSKVAEVEASDVRTVSFKDRREAAARAAQRNMGETPQQTGQEAVTA